MIEIATNDQETGDWIVVKKDGVTLFQGHSIHVFNLQDILTAIGVDVTLLSMTDEEIDDFA